MRPERPRLSEYIPETGGAVTINHWFFLFLVIIGIKFLIFCIDPLPKFYLGDSWSYISTALTGWIPPDRSFVYGFVIKLIAGSAHSLTSLNFAQVATSGINSILITYILLHFFSVAPRIAFSLGIISALEPLQLLYERHIMTEAFSLHLFAIFVVLIFHYLKKANLLLLAVIQIVATVLVSFRLSFLPVVLINSVLLPFLAVPALIRKYDLKLKLSGSFLKKISCSPILVGVLAMHLMVSVGATYFLHAGYKHLNGFLSQKPPSYQYQAGIFLLAFWAPVIKPVDLPRSDISDTVFSGLKYDLANRGNRAAHHWSPGGLVSRINEAIPDALEADRVARETALNALKRDPVSVASLAVYNFFDFWDLNWLHASMKSDIGDRPLPVEMLGAIRNNFNLAADKLPFLETFTKRYYLLAWPWYLFLLFIPIVALGCLFICKKDTKVFCLVLFIQSSLIISVVCALNEGPTVRFLHSVAWLSFLCIGVVSDDIWQRLQAKKY